MNAKQTNQDKIIVHSCFKQFCFAKLIRLLCYISAYENTLLEFPTNLLYDYK